MEKIKFYSNRFKQDIECEVLEKRKNTWKLKTPKGTFEELKKVKQYIKNALGIKVKVIESLQKVKITKPEKIIIKKLKYIYIF